VVCSWALTANALAVRTVATTKVVSVFLMVFSLG
jgi:hypothetical protein